MREVPAVAAAEIERLRADGVVVTDDDVVWLASLGRRVECPNGETPEAVGIRYGIRLSDGTIMRPQTIGASAWLDRFGDVFGGDNSAYIVAFALCHPLEVLQSFGNASDVVDAVNDWRAGLAVTYDEMCDAMARILDGDAPPRTENDDEPESTESKLAKLVAITGLPFEYWEQQTWARAGAVDSGAFRWAMMLSPFGENARQSESREALRDLLRAIIHIRERKPEESENG